MDRLGSYQARQRLQYEKQTPAFIKNMLEGYEAPRRHFTSTKRKKSEDNTDEEDNAPTIVHLDDDGREVSPPNVNPSKEVALLSEIALETTESSSLKAKSAPDELKEAPSVDSSGKLLFKRKKPSKESGSFHPESSSSPKTQKGQHTLIKTTAKKNSQKDSASKAKKNSHLLSFS